MPVVDYLHLRHTDYLTVIHGRATFGLHDLRPQSMTFRRSAVYTLTANHLETLVVPPGILHGFYHHEPSLLSYGVDTYFDPADELACHWADPALAIEWPCSSPILSERDRLAGSYAALAASVGVAV